MEKGFTLKIIRVAKLIQISQGSLSDIENNKSLPSADTIAKLNQYTNLNIIWLLTGRGAIKETQQTAAGEDDTVLNEVIQKLVRTYYRGDTEKKAHLLDFLASADPGE